MSAATKIYPNTSEAGAWREGLIEDDLFISAMIVALLDLLGITFDNAAELRNDLMAVHDIKRSLSKLNS